MPREISRLLIVVSLFLAVVPGQPAGAAMPSAQAFDQGVKAFRAGDYRAALQSFLEARRAGMNTPGLRYNLGATYYRLQRYPDAESEFQALARDPEWAPVAHYNLALTMQRMGREQQAIEHFQQAHRTTNDQKLRALAATALERLGRTPLPSRTGVVASLAGGYDGNALLSSDSTITEISDKSDFFVEGLAVASHRLSGNSARGSYADGGLILRKYGDLDQFDLIGLHAGLIYETDSGPSKTSGGGYLEVIYVGGERLEQSSVLDVQARRRMGADNDLRGRYRLGHVDGGGEFDYLDGWQHRFTADAGFPLAPARVRVGYQLELNNRRDLQQGSEFFSYSPTRHSLFTTVAVPNSGGWSADARGEYRISRYNDPHLLNGGSLAVTREDSRYGIALRANRRLTALWRVIIDWSYYRNKSNLDTYDYGRHQLMAGVEAALEK